MNVRYRVTLTRRSDVAARQRSCSAARARFARLKRAQILLAADAGSTRRGDRARTSRVGTSTVYRTKQRFVEEGLERALSEAPRPGARAQARREGGGAAGRDGVLGAARGASALDAGAAGRRDGAADRRTTSLSARDGPSPAR